MTNSAERMRERACTLCEQIKPYTTEHFPVYKAHAHGNVCRMCAKNRRRDKERIYKQKRVAARTYNLATLVETSLTPTAKAPVVSKSGHPEKGELPMRQLDVAKALRHGAAALNEQAQGILITVFEYAANSASPHHEWALRLIAERIIPRKLYEDLGSAAAGIKAGQGNVRPAVTIIVQPATVPAPAEPFVQVIEGEVVK